MRKCKTTMVREVIRFDELLLSMWSKSLHDRGLSGVDPTIDSRERREFYTSNRKYCEHIEVIGLFHEWGIDFEEFENGPGNYTIGIVELPDGSIITVPPNKITFIKEDNDGSETDIQ